MPNRARHAITALLGAAVIAVACGAVATRAAALPGLPSPIFVAWNTNTPQQVASAARVGANTVILYGDPPTPESDLGQALSQANMHVISAQIAQRVNSYQCTRTRTTAPPPPGADEFCAADPGYSLADLLYDAGRIAQRDAQNPLISGYWLLDDVAGWDTGGMRDVITQIRPLLPKSQPTICGFSASLGGGSEPAWDSRRAANFSAEACDAVAPYIYSTPVRPGGYAHIRRLDDVCGAARTAERPP